MENIGLFARMIRIVLPFLGEILFGDKHASAEVMRRNKIVVFLIGCLFVGFAFYYHNSYLYDELLTANYSLGEKLAVLQSKYDAVLQTNQLYSQELSALHSNIVAPQNGDAKAASSPPSEKPDELKSLKEENDRLRKENERLKHHTEKPP